MSRSLILTAAIAALLLASGTAGAVVPTEDHGIAVLRGLDKVTARVITIDAPLNHEIVFGTLHIKVMTCRKPPPEEQPESAAFMEVFEAKPNEAMVAVFKGWMFASSPALSPLEHPVYDLWLTDCKDAEVKAAPAAVPPIPAAPSVTVPAAKVPSGKTP